MGRHKRVQAMVQAIFLGVAVEDVEQVDHGREVDADGLLDGGHAQGDRQMGLADARRAQEQDVLAVGDEAQGGQLADLALADGGLKGKVELVQGLDEREVGQLGLHGDIPLVAGRDFGLQQVIQEVEVGPVVLGRLFAPGVQALGHAGQLEAGRGASAPAGRRARSCAAPPRPAARRG